MPGVQSPAVTAGRIGAGRGQRPVAGPGERLDRVAARGVGHGVHRTRGAGPAGGLGRAGEGRQRADCGEPDGTCRRRTMPGALRLFTAASLNIVSSDVWLLGRSDP